MILWTRRNKTFEIISEDLLFKRQEYPSTFVYNHTQDSFNENLTNTLLSY